MHGEARAQYRYADGGYMISLKESLQMPPFSDSFQR